MSRPKLSQLLFIIVITSTLYSCAAHQMYRTNLELCADPVPETNCTEHALQQQTNANTGQPGYMLGFIEFDDQGQLWSRQQMTTVTDQINAMAGTNDVLMVVFAHGWKHSAAPHDDNILTFRNSLQRIAELENLLSQKTKQKPRTVFGVYLGWRGGSVTMPLIKELTFWDRKDTAHKVGHGGVTEVLTRLELIQKTKDAIVSNDGKKKSRTRLAIIGHSFGGAVIFSALSQILEARFVDTHGPTGQITDARSFGDLVVLINPAFEAARYAALSDMTTERGSYFASQLPVLAVLTSEADLATKWAFPIGRWFSTFWEKEHEVERKNGLTRKLELIDQGSSNITTIGHFDPYITHYLRPSSEDVERESIAPPSLSDDVNMLYQVSGSWQNDTPGKQIAFFGSTLERTKTSAGRNPYLNIRVHKTLIEDHNDIDDPRIISFIRQLIMFSSNGESLQMAN